MDGMRKSRTLCFSSKVAGLESVRGPAEAHVLHTIEHYCDAAARKQDQEQVFQIVSKGSEDEGDLFSRMQKKTARSTTSSSSRLATELDEKCNVSPKPKTNPNRSICLMDSDDEEEVDITAQ